MGLSTYAILNPPYISVIKSNSTQGLSVTSNKGWMFGIVDAVNYNNMRQSIGRTVVFNADKAILVTQSNALNNYFIVDENTILFQEKDAGI